MVYFLKLIPKKRNSFPYRTFFGKKKDPGKCKKGESNDGSQNITYGSIYEQLFARCPKNQEKYLKTLYAKHQQYLSRLEVEIPKLDWEKYKANIPDNVKWVEDFEKQYKNFKIPRPEMPKEISILLDEELLETKQRVNEFIEASKVKVMEFEQEMEYLQSMLPYTEMTMEDYANARPESAPDFINNPTFWPHTPEENSPQTHLGYSHGEQDESPIDEDKVKVEKPTEKRENTGKKNETKPEDKK